MNAIQAPFRALAQCLPEALLCVSTSGAVLESNRPAQRMLGRASHGFSLMEVAAEDEHELEPYLNMCYRSRSFLPGTLRLQRSDGDLDDLRTWGVRLEFEQSDEPMVLLRLEDKKEATAVFVALNRELQKLTKQRRQLNKQRNLIHKQKAELLEFSAPMIDVWKGVLLVPLFGVLDDAYFDRILSNLLDVVARKGTRRVILDLTGTRDASAVIAAGMVRIARATRLLGARCILAGLQPKLARLFAVHHELPEDLAIASNLHTALAMCLREQDTRGRAAT